MDGSRAMRKSLYMKCSEGLLLARLQCRGKEVVCRVDVCGNIAEVGSRYLKSPEIYWFCPCL